MKRLGGDSFLGATLASPVLLDASPSLTALRQYLKGGRPRKSSAFDPWVEIHRENLRHNVQEISRRVASRPILAVIKNNRLRHGCCKTSPSSLNPQPEILGFAVVKLHDSHFTPRHAGIRKPILLLGPFRPNKT